MDNNRTDTSGEKTRRIMSFRDWALSLDLAPSTWSRGSLVNKSKPQSGIYLMMMREKLRVNSLWQN